MAIAAGRRRFSAGRRRFKNEASKGSCDSPTACLLRMACLRGVENTRRAVNQRNVRLHGEAREQ